MAPNDFSEMFTESDQKVKHSKVINSNPNPELMKWLQNYGLMHKMIMPGFNLHLPKLQQMFTVGKLKEAMNLLNNL